MKRAFLTLALAALVLADATAQPSIPYVGLFADGDHAVSTLFYQGQVTAFELWIWWWPSERGSMGACLSLDFPSNVMPGSVTMSSEVATVGCECPSGEDICARFLNCQQPGWVWSHHVTCYLMDVNPSVIAINPAGGESAIMVANCEPGFPEEPATVVTHFCLNQWHPFGCEVASEPWTWSAIKRLFR